MTTKITASNKSLADVPAKYCRIILTEDKPNWHRLVETTTGTLEYRMGAGKQKDMTPRTLRTLIRSVVRAAKAHQLTHIAVQFDLTASPQLKKQGSDWFMRTLAVNLTLASYEFTDYKTEVKDHKPLREVLVCGVSTPAEKRSFSAGLTLGQATSITRDIANTTGDDMTPGKLAAAAKRALTGTKTVVKILDQKAIKQQKMGLLTAVGKGADDRERFIIMEYWGAGKNSKTAPIVLVGKGITYDTGGLNIKPSGFMHEMHLDMSGGASVIGSMWAIAKLGLKKNVIGLVPAAENAVSATSMRAGDIVTSLSGKTVEILHTDAEGRLVLADALTYAQKHYKPRMIVDVATLTGAALAALGQHASAVLTKDDSLRDELVTLGEETGDLVWPLPLWDEYKPYLKSSRADVSNIATNFSRYGGTIEGGTFLSFFVDKKIRWAHLDIAPRMDSIPSDKLAKGATGEPVQLLVTLVERS